MKHSITLTPSDHAKLLALGNGVLSAGVAKAAQLLDRLTNQPENT